MDLINQYRLQGMSIHEAVVEGGRRRLRPILMTAVATICALTPMAPGVTQSGGFISRPLAIVVIGGLISSTLLTLVLVPTLYTMVDGASERRAKRRAKVPRAEPMEPALSWSAFRRLILPPASAAVLSGPPGTGPGGSPLTGPRPARPAPGRAAAVQLISA
jgi:HAE1 family hydrophobic/amphiphilic exporter-1